MKCPQRTMGQIWRSFGVHNQKCSRQGFCQKKNLSTFLKSTNSVPGELEELIAGDFLSSQPVYLVVNNSLTIVPF